MGGLHVSTTSIAANQSARTERQAWRLSTYVITIALALLFMFPFVWTVSSSLKTIADIMAYPPTLLPSALEWQNYLAAWDEASFGIYAKNTVIVTFLSVLGTIGSSFMVAYGFARFRFPLRGFLFMVVLSTMLLPYEVTLIPVFLLFRMLGWVDTWLPLIVPHFFASGAFYVFLLRQFILTIPYELDEAALMDGASRMRILWDIIVPNSRPALATVGVLSFIASWNDFLGPLIFLNSQEKFTVSIGLYSLRTYVGEPGEPKDHLIMAGAVMATLPIVVLFFAAQKYFVHGIVTTGLKG